MDNLGFNVIDSNFFNRPTVKVARDLIDKHLITNRSGKLCGGRIVETEAYLGTDDTASHASVGVTKRNKVMYGIPGVVYVYLIYGMHYCFNIVCEKEGTAGAVLVRAIQPEIGIEEMRKRRKKSDLKELTSGPAKLTQALKISISDNWKKIPYRNIYFLDNKKKQRQINCSHRIGISKSCHLNYRFYVKNNEFVS